MDPWFQATPFWLSQESLTALDWFLRAAVTFGVLFFVAKVMGQRKLGELHIFDFIIAITIGGIAANPLTNPDEGLIGAFISLGFFAGVAASIAYLSVKYPKVQRVMDDDPVILVQNGHIWSASIWTASGASKNCRARMSKVPKTWCWPF